ncbi:AAA family ATPase [Actinomadura sp. GC306]|uniref:AAA family ATPase n=1 Tax=Actinomadura sp. GC306 TaxID=2530367 RepID=UPI0010455362|nr:AAA family ATPase [Actinomadura sp. GC306]TDC70796.1 AAA family ATPase [Actinomadura sp. GC306]
MTAAVPAWVRELEMAVPVYPQVLLTGNVRDRYMLPGRDGRPQPHNLLQVVRHTCQAQGFGAFLWHDMVRQRILSEQFDASVRLPEVLNFPDARPGDAPPGGGDEPADPMNQLQRLRDILVALVLNRGPAIGALFPYAPAVGGGDPNDPEARTLLWLVEALAHVAAPVPPSASKAAVTPHNTIFWVAERPEQLPRGFPVDNRRLRVISVPEPSRDERRALARRIVRNLSGVEPEDQGGTLLEAVDTLTSATHGMRNVEALAIERLARLRGLPAERLDDAARLYRVGVVDNPWASAALREKIIGSADRPGGEAYLNSRVIGQPDAVRQAVQVITRSATGLTGAQTGSSPNRPRGVLFLSGPTGVGKTELAKGIAQLIIGDDAEPIRFDMSEFAGEHARDRLIGAPPGYVGHDTGGELTNAVRANPMSVLLFDEIDKAHPRLFDLFLQILEDGRLTDGRGATVFFTETVLIFTSNLGIRGKGPSGEIVELSPQTDRAAVQKTLRAAFNEFFDKQIGRPELRNRFGGNFIAMNFIQPEHVPGILDRALGSVIERVRRVHDAELEVGDDAYETLRGHAVGQLDHGGRGVLNLVESALVNPLSVKLFEVPATPGETITVVKIDQDGEHWKLGVDRCPG